MTLFRKLNLGLILFFFHRAKALRSDVSIPETHKKHTNATEKKHQIIDGALGCSTLCIENDLDIGKAVVGPNSSEWDCVLIQDFVLHSAAQTDCEGFIDHFAPLCCISQSNETPRSVEDCSACGGCLVGGVCLRSSVGGVLITEAACVRHAGKWCGLETATVDEYENDEEHVPDEEIQSHMQGSASSNVFLTEDTHFIKLHDNISLTGVPPTLQLVSGSCQVNECSASSNNYPNHYSNKQACKIKVLRRGVLDLHQFHTERDYDKLTVNGKTYHGTYAFAQTLNGLLLEAGTTIEWFSDLSVTQPGWSFSVEAYKEVGVGYCKNGYYAGWVAADAASLEKCLQACERESKCLYAALLPGKTCSRYDARAKNCDTTLTGNTDHITYRKMYKTYDSCTGGDFVKTTDRCRSGSVTLTGPHVHHGLRHHWSEVRFGGAEGSHEVRWNCNARRRRCGLFGCGSTGHERTGFNPPANGAKVYYNHHDNGRIDFYPKYTPPINVEPVLSPTNRGCCSIADGTVDWCRSRSYIKIQVGAEWKRCYKGQTCEFTFPTPQSQGVRLDWYCGNTKEGVRWGLYFDVLQVRYHCNGMLEWNPWWCGLHTTGKPPPEVVNKLAGLIGVSTGGDIINQGGSSAPLPFNQIKDKIDDFMVQNKKAVCEGMSAGAVYDQLLKPSNVCWRAGMTARSSLFEFHSDFGSKTSLFEESTVFERGQHESSPFLAAMERVKNNATLLQLAAAGNLSHNELFIDPFQTYCELSGGTDCDAIGKERCTCYCVTPGTCTSVMAAKYGKAALAILEMALDIVSVVASGGTATAAKAGAKAAAKASMKAVAKKAARSGGKMLAKRATGQIAKAAAKRMAKFGMKSRLKRSVAKNFAEEWGQKTIKQKIKQMSKEKVVDAMESALTKVACENLIDEVFDEPLSDPDWVNDPNFRWGDVNGPEGILETVDITGIVGLVGIFHEADCPAPVPEGVRGDSCPR